MNTTNQEKNRDSSVNALQALRSVQPPTGMQERVMQTLAARAREQAAAPASVWRRYAWELWAGGAIAVAAAVVMFGILSMRSHHVTTPGLEANVQKQIVVPVPSPADAAQMILLPRTEAHSISGPQRHAPRKEVADVSHTAIPHAAPPMPLTSQERLLIALASTPSLAASAAVSQPVRDHGLGANALFELGHQRLTPLRPAALESTPLRPLASNSIFSGENQ